MKLAIVVTHPIRYFVPLVQLLTQRGRINIKVFYTYGPELLTTKKYNPEHWKKTEPDLPIYEGYDFTFVHNTAKKKSTYHYKGINNPTLISEIKQWNPEAILICGWKFKSHLGVLRYFKGKIPVHFRGDSTLLEEIDYNLPKKIFRRLLLRWVYAHIDIAWYVGVQNKKYYRKLGLRENQLIHVPHVVDNKRFSRTPELRIKAMHLRREHDIPDDAVVFLFSGQMIERKQVSMLIRAFIGSATPTAHLVLVGAGKQLNELKQLAANQNNIRFLPAQTQTSMPLIYSAAEVLILPSRVDTWGLVVNEAMSNGLAVIASSQCGSAYDLVEDGRNGYFFTYDNEQRLSELVKELSANPGKTRQMGEHSLQKIRQYSYDVAATAIEQLLLKHHA